jgi:hypothetical protein
MNKPQPKAEIVVRVNQIEPRIVYLSFASEDAAKWAEREIAPYVDWYHREGFRAEANIRENFDSEEVAAYIRSYNMEG